MALNVPKSDRDLLGGGAAQQSDRYSGVSWSRIAHVQRTVSQSFANNVDLDSLAELETLEAFTTYLSKQGLIAEATSRCAILLSHRRFVEVQRTVEIPKEDVSEVVLAHREVDVSEEERRKVEKSRRTPICRHGTQKEQRDVAKHWAATRNGHVNASGRCWSRVFTLLSPRNAKSVFFITLDLAMLPGLDFQQHLYLGTVMPHREHFEQIWKKCAVGRSRLLQQTQISEIRRQALARRKQIGCFRRARGQADTSSICGEAQTTLVVRAKLVGEFAPGWACSLVSQLVVEPCSWEEPARGERDRPSKETRQSKI